MGKSYGAVMRSYDQGLPSLKAYWKLLLRGARSMMTKARRAKAKSTRNACPWTIFLMENENISAKGLLHTKITKSARERYAIGLPSRAPASYRRQVKGHKNGLPPRYHTAPQGQLLRITPWTFTGARSTRHSPMRASHTLYFDTILLTNGGPTTGCPSA